MLQFRSYRSRLLVFLIGLLSLVLGTVFIAVNRANVANARVHLEEALQITAGSFAKDLKDRERILTEKVRLLSGDFAFKSAFATRDRETILSALENHRLRANADVMLLLSMEGATIADTLHPDGESTNSHMQALLAVAMENEFGQASAIQIIGDQAYQMVVVPLFTPEPSAWILIGFIIDDAFTRTQREHTRSEVSLLYRHSDANWQIIGTTLDETARQQLQAGAAVSLPVSDKVFDLALKGEDYLSLTLDIQEGEAGEGIAILQRSLDAALAPYLRLRTLMLILFGIGLVLSSAGAALIARGLSRPVELLVKSAHRIESGDYSQGVDIRRKDEIGTLAHSFNTMVKGLAERDKVQKLLGKVVSREIADELLSKKIELGGEEREVTVLFSDVRSFTNLCEGVSPEEILDLLNRYLTRMSAAVEGEGGVVDKYIGDAIMALFGAPIQHADSPERAVRCSLKMHRELVELNKQLLLDQQLPLAIGVGINTGNVVAGNMGSKNRLNYTVIGDGVNLASRLEGLTKYYGVDTIISESTRAQCPSMTFRELDLVRVKGKTEPVAIYQPLDDAVSADNEQQALLARYHAALALYRQREWNQAEILFQQLADEQHGSKIHSLYLTRINTYKEDPPAADWNGVAVFTEK